MTRQEFILRQKHETHHIVLPFYVVLLTMVISSIGWMEFLLLHPGASILVSMTGNIICLGICIFGVWYIYFHSWRVQDRSQFRCSKCRESFAATQEQVLASGKCYYCRHQVIDDFVAPAAISINEKGAGG